MKLGSHKKRKVRGAPVDEPVNHLRRAILETLTVLIWPVLIIGSLIATGKVTETLVMSCIIPVIFAMNAVKDFKTHKEDKAAEKAAKGKDLSTPSDSQKVLAALARRGYDYSLARQAIEHIR